MIGFGNVFGKPFTEVHDDLYVRALMMPDATVLCFGYNDAIAYVPSDKIIEEGGYEAEGSVTEYRLKGRIAPGVDKIYCDALKQTAAEMNK